MKARILFATVPLEGHFNPLTSLAMHLKAQGHDVRWYTGRTFQQKLEKLHIPHFPFIKALEVNSDNIEEIFPERKQYKSLTRKLKFDIKNVFVRRAPEYYLDIKEINKTFPFDVMIADASFGGIPMVRELLHKPVIAIGIIPLMETSRDLAPYGMGITPSGSLIGQIRQQVLRFVARNLLLKGADQAMNHIFRSYAMKPATESIFDVMIRRADLYLQSGVPGFEYHRSDLSQNIRFIGSLLPYRTKTLALPAELQEKLGQYRKVILVTQGTVERDVEKIIVPTLEAFKGTDYLVVATTGGSQTDALRARYPQANIIIEDFIDFNAIMPHADIYVTNGGYGGVLLGIEHALPLVVAGIHEGKSEINARVGYFKLGINLKTEHPTQDQIRISVEEVLQNKMYKKRVEKLREEFHQYDSAKHCEAHVNELLGITQPKQQPAGKEYTFELLLN